jgi:Family of unknown function (DUF6152)
MRNAAVLCVVAALVAASATVRAHHGYGGFFDPKDRTVAVEGDLVSFVYGNPHVVMKIRSADSSVYTVTWQAASWVERQAHVTKSTFHVGDHLIIIGAPSRDSASHDVTRVREVRRPADGWAWRDAGEFARPVAGGGASN